MKDAETEEKRLQEEGKAGQGKSLGINISDSDLADIIDSRIEKTLEAEDKDKLPERRKINRDFWLGKQIKEESLNLDFQIPAKDNLIWQDLETRIGIISSKLPDISITPPNQTAEKRDRASTLEKALNIKLGDSMTRRLAKDGLRNHALDFIAAIKARWDRDTDDITFDLVRAKKLIIDHTATIPHDGFTADNMEMIVEMLEEPTARVIEKFPDKRDDILEAVGAKVGTSKQFNSKLRYQEIWYTFYGSDALIYEGTCWKIKKIILDNQKSCYYDWEGYEEVGSDSTVLTKYRNHFERPRKPYIFFSYQNLGESPQDDTTVVEQTIPLQRLRNKRLRQITEISDRCIPKMVFTADAMSKEQARNLTNNPDESVVLGGNVTDVKQAFTYVVAQPPSQELFADLDNNERAIDAKFATHAVTRGEIISKESGVSKQITKQGDLASFDDMSRLVVERVFYEMASWTIQLMKLFYEKEHLVKDVGKEGEGVFIELKRDIIDDGVGVNVIASSSDKEQRRQDAQIAARMKLIDPLSYWEMQDVTNPKEITRRLLTFMAKDMKTYTEMTDLALQDKKDYGVEEAQLDIEKVKNGDKFEVPMPTPLYIQTFIQYIQSDEYNKLSDAEKNKFKKYVQELKDKFANQPFQPDQAKMQGGQGQMQPQTQTMPPPAQPGAQPTNNLPVQQPNQAQPAMM